MLKILFPYEFGPLAEQAEDEVLFLAKKLAAEVILMQAVPKAKGLLRSVKLKNEKKLVTGTLQALEKVKDRLVSEHGLKIEVFVTEGKLETAVVQAAKETGAGLIIFGTEGGESRWNAYVSSPVNYVIQHAPCPCLTIRERPKRKDIDDILVVQNPDQPYNLHYQWAIKLAKALGTWIRILVIYDPKESDHEDAVTYTHHLARYTKEQGITVSGKETRPKKEKVPEMIISYADEFGADLIAMIEYEWPDLGTDEVTRTNSWLGKVVNRSKIPVLSARPDQED